MLDLLRKKYKNYSSSDSLRCNLCKNLWTAGAMIIPTVTRNTIPEKSAYKEANNLPPNVWRSPTGPIPPRIIEAFNNESIQLKFSI